MDEPATMHGLEGRHDHQRLLDGFTERQRPAREPLLERFPVEILHDQEVDHGRLRRLWVTSGGAPSYPSPSGRGPG